MKKYYLFIALAMVAAMSVSCKSNKKAESNEANEEVVEAAKTVLADDVLATIDEIAKTYFDEAEKVEPAEIIAASLTDKDKLVKPDYLLDPNEANNLVTRSQKINALAILLMEYTIRNAYEMPVEEAKDAIARLTVDLNHPIAIEERDSMSVSEKIAESYRRCKESGELPYFWQFEFAVQNEFRYLISQNPDLFFNNITDEQIRTVSKRFLSCREAVRTLAEYDPEIKIVVDTYSKTSTNLPDDNARVEAYGTVEAAKKTFAAKKEQYAIRRADMLK